MQRGDLITVALQGDAGKPRPALVIQADHFADLSTVVVLPLTSTLLNLPLVRVTIEQRAARRDRDGRLPAQSWPAAGTAFGKSSPANAVAALFPEAARSDAPIGRASRQRHRMAVSGAASREARTHFEAIELLLAETYLEARLETGRTHQIRAHFAAIGHPLVGDSSYGGERKYGLERQFLHAHRLAFDHPVSGERMSFRSELPADLAAALEAARTT